jgi:hypothetical protein
MYTVDFLEAEAFLNFAACLKDSTMQITWSVLFKEVVTVYSESRKKQIYTFCSQNAE